MKILNMKIKLWKTPVLALISALLILALVALADSIRSFIHMSEMWGVILCVSVFVFALIALVFMIGEFVARFLRKSSSKKP